MTELESLLSPRPMVWPSSWNAAESATLGAILASKVNVARGPAAVVLPLNGLDKYEAPPDGPFLDRDADEALFAAIRSGLRPDIPCVELPANINDASFADEVFHIFLQQWARRHGHEQSLER